MRAVVRLFVAVTLLVPSLGAVGAGAFVYHDARSTVTAAEPTNATVLDSTVERNRDSGDGTDSYQPVVEYRYTVDGETYTSDSVFPGSERSRGGVGAREWAREIAAAHPEGERVRAYYLPDDPDRSFLVAEPPTTLAALFVGLGVVGVVAAVLTALFG